MKLLASDFDKTLYVDDINILNKNIKLIHEFREKDNCFIIITGRQYSDIKPLLKRHHILYDYLICEDGAVIYDKNDNVIRKIFIDKQELVEMVSIIKKYKTTYLFDDGISFCKKKEDPIKVAISYQDKEQIKPLLEELKKLNLYIYVSETWINITNREANKYDTIQWMIEYLNVDKKEVYSIGDGINDREMLKYLKGVMISSHHDSLQGLKLEKYDTLFEYVEELVKD